MVGNDRGDARLRRVCRHVIRGGARAAARAWRHHAVPQKYQLAVLGPDDAADCEGLMPGVEMWRSSINDADMSWGYRVRGSAGSELVACAFLYTARAGGSSTSAGHCTVSNVLTSADHRRVGLARSLMLELLHAANGRPTSLYASEMGAPLYVQLGFKTVDVVVQFSCRRHCTLEIAAAAARAAGVVVTVTTAPTTADIMLVGELDSAMFGGDRMALLQSALGLGADATLAVARNASGEVVAFAASARPNAFSQGGHCTTYHTASIFCAAQCCPHDPYRHARSPRWVTQCRVRLCCRCAIVRSCGCSHCGRRSCSANGCNGCGPISCAGAACGVDSAPRAAVVCGRSVGPRI